ncbi:hypothetical protein [Paraburkholderia kururiensis]|uniref:hypothetical protein n=1 Tax=Paraburkholderia kururiensis TaxID=984307 RepID=UPI00034C6BC1|nr:hypothetical protein [Paraburkholderia kururiensis]
MTVTWIDASYTDQSGWLVERIDGGQKTFFCCEVGRDFASPSGGWASDPKKALRFARERDAQQFLSTFLRHEAPFCQIIEHEWRKA